jgi:hypothetical protein
MVSEIRIYVEGDPALRQGFHSFFEELRELARRKNVRWNVITCGARNLTYEAFKTALKTHPDAFNVLLVDAEESVDSNPWEHLRRRDGWSSEGCDDEQCHLMVQTMEAWFMADIEALKRYYKQGFQEGALPKNLQVEQLSKNDLNERLKRATQHTQKRAYHKTRHAPHILAQIDVANVCQVAPHCNRLFITLRAKLQP